MEDNSKKLNSRLPVVFHKELSTFDVSFNFSSVWERRLFLVLCSKIIPLFDYESLLEKNPEKAKEFRTISFDRNDFVALIERCLDKKLRSGRVNEELEEVANSLLSFQIRAKKENGDFIKVNAFSTMRLTDGRFKAIFNADFFPFVAFILGRSGYSRFLLESGLKIQKNEAFNFYKTLRPMVYEAQPTKNIVFSLDELRTIFNVDGYERVSDFLSKVVSKSVSDINASTELEIVEVERVKAREDKRKVWGVSFKIKLKPEGFRLEYDYLLLYSPLELFDKINKKLKRLIGLTLTQPYKSYFEVGFSSDEMFIKLALAKAFQALKIDPKAVYSVKTEKINIDVWFRNFLAITIKTIPLDNQLEFNP